MSRPRTGDRQFGERLRSARESSHHRLDDVAVHVREKVGYGPSRETIRRWETGLDDEERVDPVVLAALAEIYGVELQSLSRVAERNARRIIRLLRRQLDEAPTSAEHLAWIGMGESDTAHGRDADELLAGGFGT